MSHTILTTKQASAIFSKDAAAVMSNEAKFLKTIGVEDSAIFKDKYKSVKSGDTIGIKKPPQYTIRTGLTYSGQDITQESVTMTVATVKGVDINGLTGINFATDLSMDQVKNISAELIMPAAKRLIAEVEKDVMATLYTKIGNYAGTPGVTPNSRRAIGACRSLLQKNLAPESDNYLLINSDAELELGEAFKGMFNPSPEISKLHKEGYLGRTLGFDVLCNELIPYHTNGNDVSGVAVEASVVTPAAGMTTLGVDGLTADTGTVTAGSIITIDGVYAVNPETKQVYSYLAKIPVLSSVTAGAAGTATLSIPALYASGGRQNVSALPADEAAITFVGSASTAYPQNLFYNKDAFRFMSLPLPKMDDANMFGQATMNGVDVTFHSYWDKDAYALKTRLDVLYGSAVVRSEHAGRLWG